MARTWLAHERSTTWFKGLDPEWLTPEILGCGRVLTRRRDEIGLELEGWVGSARLLNGDTIHIASKFGDADFMRMLLRAEDLRSPLPAESTYGRSASQAPAEYAVASFIEALRIIYSLGEKLAWRGQQVISRTRPTRVHVARTLMRVKAGSEVPFVGVQETRTRSTPEHRVLAAAASYALSAQGRARQSPEVDLLKSWSRREWDPARLRADLSAVQAGLIDGRYVGSRGYYSWALQLATVILGLNGMAVQGSSAFSASGALINSDTLFETYIRRVLFEAFRDRGLTFEKELPNSTYLFDSGLTPMVPDILIRRGARLIGLGDVKHKAPTASDYYQLFTYLRQYDLRSGFLLTVGDVMPTSATLLTRRDGVVVRVIPLPIGNLDALETQLVGLDTQLRLEV